ncbi:hypothetical protein EZS27_013488 [termite gut metagenome]|uniref:Uncharacterized protein n=1 Tax=termite gut metagenome TaxID=433724 RepID=A0A5J4RZR8_9ZZZZ
MVAKNKEDALKYLRYLKALEQGVEPKEKVETCPHGGTHIHYYTPNKRKGKDIIVCEKCFLNAAWTERINYVDFYVFQTC